MNIPRGRSLDKLPLSVGNYTESSPRRPYILGAAILMIAALTVGFVVLKPGIADQAGNAAVLRTWDTPRPFQAPTDLVLNVFAEPSQKSQVIVKLQPTAVAYAIGEFGVEGAPRSESWSKVRTGSGAIGWVRADYGEPLTIAQAEELTLRQQQRLEEDVREAIVVAVAEALRAKNIHGGGPPEEMRITAPLSTAESASELLASVSALMRGAVWSSNRYQVDSRVSLFLHIDKDFLPASKIEIGRVEILNNQMTTGLSGGEALSLFSKIVLF